MKLEWVTNLGALSHINTILIPRISAHPPVLAQCKVHRPWALFREGTVYMGHMQEWKINTVYPWINIAILYILNQKCMILIIEKNKRRDV